MKAYTDSQISDTDSINPISQQQHDCRGHNDASQTLEQIAMNIQINHAGNIHPNFDASQTPPDPDRPLDEVTTPAPRFEEGLKALMQLDNETKPVAKHGGKSCDAQPSSQTKAKHHANRSHDQADTSPTVAAAHLSQHRYALAQSDYDSASMWSLISSPDLASHLELLQLGGLLNLPAKFFEPIDVGKIHANHQAQANKKIKKTEQSNLNKLSTKMAGSYELLSPLTQMRLLDLSDIYKACACHPNLSRYGLDDPKLQSSSPSSLSHKSAQPHIDPTSSQQASHDKASHDEANLAQDKPDIPEMLNDMFAPNWELILYPERFDNGVDSLSTDILACSVAVHVLKQCQTRKSVNRRLTAQQICQHMRSYVLSQCKLHPQYEQQYRQIRLFVGHVVVAATYLGLSVTEPTAHTSSPDATDTNENNASSKPCGQPIYLNISSRASLFTRYPDISSYYINGWS